jgi:HEAT repeat protein
LNGSEIQTYIEMLKHKDPEVRYWAVLYLEHIADAAAVPALIEVLTHDDNDLRGAAAKALAKLGSEAREAIPALTSAAQDEDVWVNTTAAYALRMIEVEG